MIRWKRRTIGASLFVGLLGPSSALANGRFPLANQLVVDPTNHAHMVARATFGILDTDDGGVTWTWICEDAVGYFGIEDPSIAVTANGSTIAASSRGLSRSADGGCSWSTAELGATPRSGVDVTTSPMNPHEALALESIFVNGVYSVSLVQTMDDGATWTEVAPLPANILAQTVEIAPSNPDRVYVSAHLSPTQQSVLLRSDDGGQTWTQSMIDLPVGASAYIGAVDPHDADVVYIRADVPTSAIGRVDVTRDAGMTWTQIWSGQGSVAGFALSGDGAALAVGGPASGINVASTSDMIFSSANPLGPSCLTWVDGRLFACAREAVDRFSIGASDDNGTSFVPVLHFSDITPRACGASTSAAVCASSWPPIAASIGVDAGAPNADSLARARNSDAGGGWNCTASAPGRARSDFGWGVLGWLVVFARKARRRAPMGERFSATRRV